MNLNYKSVRKVLGKFSNISKLNNELLNNAKFKIIKREVRKYFVLNRNKNRSKCMKYS